MKFKSDYNLRLEQLNDDCLLQIFKKLNLREQFTLQKLNQHFENVILCIWRHKYRTSIDFRQESQLKLLQEAELGELLSIVVSYTSALLNVDELLNNAYFQRQVFANIVIITAKSADLPDMHATFPKLECLHLQQTTIDYENLSTLNSLTDLQLKHCTPQNNSSLAAIFRNLHLKSFSFVPPVPPAQTLVTIESPTPLLKSIEHCGTLQRLTLKAADVATALSDIIQLAQLQRLTVLISDDSDASPTLSLNIVAKLAAATQTAQRLVGARFKCNFDARILLHLQRLPHLRAFAWYSHLHVDHVNAEGLLRWYAYKPQETRRAVLKLIAVCHSLEQLDLRWNCHIGQDFVSDVLRALLATAGKDGDASKATSFVHVKSDYFGNDDDDNDGGFGVGDYEQCKTEMCALKEFGYFELDFRKVI